MPFVAHAEWSASSLRRAPRRRVGEVVAVIAPSAGLAIDFVGDPGTAASLVNDAVLSRRIFAFYATLQFTENAMVQRGNGLSALQTGKLTPEAFLLMSKGVTLNATFHRLFNDYAVPEAFKKYQAFDAASGQDLRQLRELILKNTGTPASEARVRRWTELSRDLTSVLSGVVVSTADLISAEADRMIAAAWHSSMLYLGGSITMVMLVVFLSWTVLHIVRRLLGGLTGTMEALGERRLDITVPSVERGDEIGVLARAAENFRANLARIEALEAEQKEAEGRAAAQRKADM